MCNAGRTSILPLHSATNGHFTSTLTRVITCNYFRGRAFESFKRTGSNASVIEKTSTSPFPLCSLGKVPSSHSSARWGLVRFQVTHNARDEGVGHRFPTVVAPADTFSCTAFEARRGSVTSIAARATRHDGVCTLPVICESFSGHENQGVLDRKGRSNGKKKSTSLPSSSAKASRTSSKAHLERCSAPHMAIGAIDMQTRAGRSVAAPEEARVLTEIASRRVSSHSTFLENAPEFFPLCQLYAHSPFSPSCLAPFSFPLFRPLASSRPRFLASPLNDLQLEPVSTERISRLASSRLVSSLPRSLAPLFSPRRHASRSLDPNV